MVCRIYVEKKAELAVEAARLMNEAKTLLGMDRLKGLRIANRYDTENIEEQLFEECIWKVFAEPQLDNIARTLEELTECPIDDKGFVSTGDRVLDQAATQMGAPACVFAAGIIPGRPDRRADAAEECIQLISRGERPVVRSAKVYVLYGELMPADIDAFKKYVINPAETAEVPLELPDTLIMKYERASESRTLEGFMTMTEPNFPGCIKKMKLGMNEADLALCVEYFRDTEQRDPTLNELRVIDSCWSESQRHAAFNTVIDSVTFEDPLLEKAYKDYLALRRDLRRNKPVTLRDVAAIAARQLRRMGRLDKLDESGISSPCSVMINVETGGENEPWLLLIGNGSGSDLIETEPSAGAAYCFGGCVRDTIAGRAYAYAAMRLTGAGDPLRSFSDTINGRFPERTVTTEAARGASEYANQAGIATGIADEIYHPGFAAKRLEACAVLAAAPAVSVRSEEPAPGDIVLILGGQAVSGGISSSVSSGSGQPKTYDSRYSDAGSDFVQEGSAAEERKMQRLFRSGVATRIVKRSTAVGAGGISASIGGLADGIDINLDAFPACYTDGRAEAVINEPEALMAVVIDAENERLFKLLASDENLRCVKAAKVTEEPRLVMRSRGRKIADISREFLSTGGAVRHVDVAPAVPGDWRSTSMYKEARNFTAAMNNLAQDFNVCSKSGLTAQFDSSAGAGTVLAPFGGRNQITPPQAMAHKIPLENGSTDDCSMMAWGYNPFISEASPYHGAYLAVIESVTKLIASGADFSEVYLCFQEKFGAPGSDPSKWGKPFASLLGAFEAQMGLGIASIGSSEAMDGSFEGLDVPPALISLAVTMCKAGRVISPEFKKAGHKVVILKPLTEKDNSGVGRGLPNPGSLRRVWEKAEELLSSGKAVAAYTPGIGGIAEAIMKMSFGNGIGFRYDFEDGESTFSGRSYRVQALEEIFGYNYGSILLELSEDTEVHERGLETGLIGYTTKEQTITFADETLAMSDLLMLYEGRMDSVFPVTADSRQAQAGNITYKARNWHTTVFKRAEPKVLIPVFPGTSCEYESVKAFREAGAVPELLIVKNQNSDDIKRSIESFARSLKDTQMVFIPGGSSAGGEPEGSAKFIAAFFRNAAVSEGVTELLDKKDGLMCGICDGFQALVKLGLVPYGRITDTDKNSPSLTYNTIGTHQSGIARVRLSSNKSPWLRYGKVGEIYSVPVSFSEGRFTAPEEELKRLAGTGQIAFQYVDLEGNATGDVRFNPGGSMMAVEAVTSPDGRVLGRMGHTERIRAGLYKNVDGKYDLNIFENAVRYFK